MSSVQSGGSELSTLGLAPEHHLPTVEAMDALFARQPEEPPIVVRRIPDLARHSRVIGPVAGKPLSRAQRDRPQQQGREARRENGSLGGHEISIRESADGDVARTCGADPRSGST